MNRTVKNIIVIAIIVVSCIALGLTTYFGYKSYHKTTTQSNTIGEGNMNNDMGTPPEMPKGENGEAPEMNGEEPPAKPDGENDNGNPPEKNGESGQMGQPPEMPNDKSNTESDSNKKNSSKKDKSSSNTEMPTMPENQMQGGQPPEMPNGENGQPPQMNGDKGGQPSETDNKSLSAGYYVAFACESILLSSSAMYLLLSKANKKTFKETFADADKIVICILVTIIFTTGATFAAGKIATINSNEETTNTENGNQFSPGENTGNISYSSGTEITEDKTINNESFSSENSDENAISASGDVDVTLSDITVTKTGDSDGGDNTSFYGTNSAIIAKDGANLTIKNATITTDANGANGVFSYGGSATTNNASSDGTTITISDSKITTSKNNSGGIMTTGGGTTIAKNLTITTAGTSSAAIRSDRGGGTVTVDGGTYKTTGQGSPTIYSTADISIKNATLTATASEGVVIEGKNTVTLDNVTLTDTNNKLNGQSTTYKNIFLYQSMSGDASSGTATFTAKDSKIITNKGDTLYVTNTSAEINLTNNTITNNDSTGNFLRVQKDSWGNNGSNGGQVTLNMNNQIATGNIVIDSISTLTMNLNNNSTFTGTINGANEAQSIKLKLDKTSKIKLTGDSYVTSLDDEDTSYSNIDFNGYKLFVNGKSIN